MFSVWARRDGGDTMGQSPGGSHVPTVQIGVSLHPQHTGADRILDAFARADALGADSIWVWDHLAPLSGDLAGAHLECWTVLTAGGLRTSRAQVGPLVLGMGYRNPALVASMAATLDNVLGGRLVLGVGAGWVEREHDELGIPFGAPGERLRRLETGIETIVDRLACSNPPPVHGRIPLLVGGGGERVTLRIAARHADIWHGFGTPDAWLAKSRVLDEWCRRVDRDPAEIARSVTVADARGEARLGPATVQEELLDAYAEAGATHLIYGATAPYDFTPVERMLAWRASRRLD